MLLSSFSKEVFVRKLYSLTYLIDLIQGYWAQWAANCSTNNTAKAIYLSQPENEPESNLLDMSGSILVFLYQLIEVANVDSYQVDHCNISYC